jgi:hypothetical protein
LIGKCIQFNIKYKNDPDISPVELYKKCIKKVMLNVFLLLQQHNY